MTPNASRRIAGEFLGSALLTAVVIGSGIAAQQLSPTDTGLQPCRRIRRHGVMRRARSVKVSGTSR